MEDAVVLSELLAQDNELPDLFEQFMERRWARCKLVVEASVQVGEWELNPTPTSINDAIALSDRVPRDSRPRVLNTLLKERCHEHSRSRPGYPGCR